MTVGEIAKELELEVLTGEKSLNKEITGVYVCDLLSWVMSHAGKGNIWVTIHNHINIVAVALLTEVSCIIIPENIEVEETTLTKAMEEGVNILRSKSSAYELCCRIFQITSK
ncbi:MAG TPA: AraC family transcriptional regulator [Clostridiaceae bacterium]|nr:AraC family transcriptional regulator [Clostridiaceae bacterium]